MWLPDRQTHRWTDRCWTKWSLCAAMLRRRHKNIEFVVQFNIFYFRYSSYTTRGKGPLANNKMWSFNIYTYPSPSPSTLQKWSLHTDLPSNSVGIICTFNFAYRCTKFEVMAYRRSHTTSCFERRHKDIFLHNVINYMYHKLDVFVKNGCNKVIIWQKSLSPTFWLCPTPRGVGCQWSVRNP